MSELAEQAGKQDGDYLSWKHWEADKFGRFDAKDADYFSAELTPVLGQGPVGRVLEIGFGNGALLGWLRERAQQRHGIEVNPVLRERAATELTAVYGSLDDAALAPLAGSFDAIIAFDVIEHLSTPQLVDAFAQIATLLRPGGAFVARFPNGDSPFGRIFQHGDITHVTTIGRFKAAQLAVGSGLVLKQVRSPAYPLRYGSMRTVPRRLLVKLARKVAEAAMSQIFFEGTAVACDPNLLAIWVRPPAPATPAPA